MMKKLLLCSLLLVGTVFQSHAEIIDETAAKNKAVQFLMKNASDSRAKYAKNPTLEVAHVEKTHGDVLYYVFDKGNSEGYILVSAEDQTPAVLCYADSGKFDVDSLAPAARVMLKQYASYIDRVRKGTAQKLSTLPVQKPIYPLLHTQWEQNWPFNVKCPHEMLTGCIATAFSQVMFYYKWPERGEGSHTYTYKYWGEDITLTLEYGKDSYRYDLMIDDWPASEVSHNAVATLMYHVGVAADMQYGYEESSASLEIALEGMKEHFKYDPNARMEYASNYDSPVWESMLYNELAEGRPVVYRGVSDSDGGHAFVLDGFNEGYFHVNWGWHGASDGFYLLTTMMGFKAEQAGCFNFKPIEHEDTPEESDGLFRWGYCNEIMGLTEVGDTINGGAIYIPTEYLQAYIGKKISGIEVGLAQECEDFECFVYKTTHPDPHPHDLKNVTDEVLAQKVVGKGHFGWNKVMFEEPIEIDGSGLFIGYTVKETGMTAVALATNDDSKVEQENYGNIHYDIIWDGQYGWSWGHDLTLCINALIVDENLPADMRLFRNMQNIECQQAGDVFHIIGTVESMMVEKIENYTVAYQIDDGSIYYHTVECNLKSKEREYFSVPVDLNLPAGVYDVRVWIDKVNGKEDAVQCNSDYYRIHPIQLKVHGQKFVRRNVMESGISNTCGFSARAIAADHVFHEKYPDSYIGINIHGDMNGPDPMSDNENFGRILSFPTTKINRKEYDNVSLSELENNLLKYSEADFDISMQAAFTDGTKDVVNILTDVVSGMNLANRDIRIAYAVTEDHVGPYPQQMWVSDLPYQWNDGDAIFHDRVGRGIYDSENGIFSSLPVAMAAGTTYQHYYQLKLPSNIDDISQIKIVAMIINQASGEIENACSCIPKGDEGVHLEFDENQVVLEFGKTKQLKLNTKGLADNAQLMWTSSNSDIASVSNAGLVTSGKKMGKADISVQVKERPYIMASCQVFVNEKSEIIVKQPGTLADFLGDNIYNYFNIKISGELNGDDLLTLRKMAGCGKTEEEKTNGRLEILDLSDARFVTGGAAYIEMWWGECYINEDDAIPDYGFYGCDKLREVICPSSCRTIKYMAFYNCTSLESIVLNEGLWSIEYGAFSYTSIRELNLPASLSQFYGQEENTISTINLAEGNESFTSIDNVLYDKNMELVYFYPTKKKDEVFIAPSSVKMFSSWIYNNYLKKLYLDGIEEVNYLSMAGMESLYAGKTLKVLDAYVLFSCPALKTILIASSEPPLVPNTEANPPVMQDFYERVILYVPRASINSYKSHEIWGNFKNILPIEEYTGDDNYDQIQASKSVLYADGAKALTGSQVTIPLKMKNVMSVTGFQCDLYLPEGIEVAKDGNGRYLIELSTVRTTANNMDNFSVAKQGDGAIRISCSSTKNYSFSGNEGEVAKLTLDIRQGMNEGVYSLMLKNVECSYYLNNAVKKFKAEDAGIEIFVEKRFYDLVLNADSKKGEITVSGDSFSGGKAKEGTQIALTAMPKEGYTLVEWMEDGNEVSGEDTYEFVLNGNRNLTAQFTMLGDVYEDETIDVADLTGTVGIILTSKAEDKRTLKAADVYKDGLIDVADYSKIVGYILNGGVVKPRPKTISSKDSKLPELEADGFVPYHSEGRLDVKLNNDGTSVANLQFDLALPEGFRVGSKGLEGAISLNGRCSGHQIATNTLDDGSVRVVVYSANNTPISGTEGCLLSIEIDADPSLIIGDYPVSLTNIVMTDGYDRKITQGDTIGNISLKVPTGIYDMQSDEKDRIIYDLAGRRLPKATKGIHVINNKKMYIK